MWFAYCGFVDDSNISSWSSFCRVTLVFVLESTNLAKRVAAVGMQKTMRFTNAYTRIARTLRLLAFVDQREVSVLLVFHGN